LRVDDGSDRYFFYVRLLRRNLRRRLGDSFGLIILRQTGLLFDVSNASVEAIQLFFRVVDERFEFLLGSGDALINSGGRLHDFADVLDFLVNAEVELTREFLLLIDGFAHGLKEDHLIGHVGSSSPTSRARETGIAKEKIQQAAPGHGYDDEEYDEND
jgi:hypothetical protein